MLILEPSYIFKTIVHTLDKTKSSFFTITNGVQQDGILAPKVLSTYMNDLLKTLRNSAIVVSVTILIIYVLMM